MPEIQNPNLQTQGHGGGGGGGDMKSTIVFFALMLAVLVGYQFFFKPGQAPAPEKQSQPAQTQSQAQSQPSQPAAQQTPPASAKAAPVKPKPNTPAIAASAESTTTVENDLYRIVFTNRGAQVRHWILKHYKDSDGKPLDLVQPQTSERFGYPLSLFTYEPELTKELDSALYQVTVSGQTPSATGLVVAPSTVTFHYAANGLDVLKKFHFDTGYVIDIQTEVKRNGVPVRALVEWPAGLGDMEEFLPTSTKRSQIWTSAASEFAWSLNGKHDSMAAKKVSNDATLDQPYSYAAVMDLYFAAAFLPYNPAGTSVVTLHNTIDLPSKLDDPTSKTKPADVIGLAIGDTNGYTHLRLFAGPKATDALKNVHAIGPDGKPNDITLEPLIEFGFWTIIAKPLYIVLRFMVQHGIGNWGWAIILFTVAFTVALLPTRFMMMKSQLKMMRIQPKVDALKNKYGSLKATDPKRNEMNAEMMALYKQEGVNMYGGCLPILVQMPLFFAYYKVLLNAVELRQAHWFWLTDLSQPDPLHILPIIIILTMFLTQYMTPTPGMDPAQRRMMAFMMPVVFGFMLWQYASGLSLYWGTSNLINMALQIGINRSHYGREMHEIAAKRAAKKAGRSPKTIQGKR